MRQMPNGPADSISGMQVATPEISVNGHVISPRLFADLLSEYPAAEQGAQETWQQVGTASVIRELLLQHAAATGLVGNLAELDDAAAEKLIDRVLERDAPAREPDDDEIERFHAANQQRLVTPPTLLLRHVLRTCRPDDAKARQQARAEVDGLIAQLRQGADFAGLAAACSDCPSRSEGGSLGQVSAGQTVPEFEQQVFMLPEGLCPRAIETRFGYHIVYVERRIDGLPLPPDSARERIATYLRDASRQQAIRHLLLRLAGEADIRGIRLDLQEDTSLLQ